MSSQNETTSETTVLLGNSRSAVHVDRSPSGERFEFSPETLLIPVALATKLATQIPATTIVELLRRAVCRLWNASHDDPTTPATDGPSPTEFCDGSEIARYFSIVVAILGATEAITSVAGCGVLSRISSHYGRKPAFLLLIITGIVGSCMIPGSQYMPGRLADWGFLLGILFQLFSGALPYAYLVNVYIVDVCIPEDRTAALSRIAGWSTLGTCISFALGGSITTKTGNPGIVFYLGAAIYVITFIYIRSFLPESFPEEKRRVLSSMCQDSSTSGLATTTCFGFLRIFEPLKMLTETHRSDGTRNWRLAWCAAHAFVFMAANAYASAAWLVLATSKYHLTPADTGLFLTIIAVSGTTVLMVILPPLIRFLRPYYRRKSIRSLLVEEDITNDGVGLDTSDRLDVHLAFASCIATAVFYLAAASSTTNWALIFSAVCIGFAFIHTPTIRSLVAGSVDPLKQGEALAAIEMVSNAGGCLSPIIMGGILTATIETTPLLLFYVHLVVVLIGGTLLFFIRDVDRYRKPHEA